MDIAPWTAVALCCLILGATSVIRLWPAMSSGDAHSLDVVVLITMAGGALTMAGRIGQGLSQAVPLAPLIEWPLTAVLISGTALVLRSFAVGAASVQRVGERSRSSGFALLGAMVLAIWLVAILAPSSPAVPVTVLCWPW